MDCCPVPEADTLQAGIGVRRRVDHLSALQRLKGQKAGSRESVDTLTGLILRVPFSDSCHVTAGAQALSRWSPLAGEARLVAEGLTTGDVPFTLAPRRRGGGSWSAAPAFRPGGFAFELPVYGPVHRPASRAAHGRAHCQCPSPGDGSCSVRTPASGYRGWRPAVTTEPRICAIVSEEHYSVSLRPAASWRRPPEGAEKWRARRNAGQ
jgi:hypothetical protein